MEFLIKEVAAGHVVLAACGAFYLAWWAVAFKPGYTVNKWEARILLAMTLILGLAAATMIIDGVLALPNDDVPVALPYLAIGGFIVYIVLLFGTVGLFKRILTAELIIMVFWAVLELSVVDVAYGAACISTAAALGLTAVIGLASAGNLVSYLLYYRMNERAAYIDGMVPLAAAALVAVLLAAVLMP